MSAESGIPTFRGNGGLWRQFRAQDLATPEAFASDPKLVWEWYDWRRRLVAAAQPNAGHIALAQLEARCPDFTLITQNVDDLHERAGSRNILHVHGSIWLVRCESCGTEAMDMRSPLPDLPPRCACGGLQRPGVVWFGENLPQDVWSQAEDATRRADFFLVVGTSGVVYPAAGLSALAKSRGATVFEVNIETNGPAGVVLPELCAQ